MSKTRKVVLGVLAGIVTLVLLAGTLIAFAVWRQGRGEAMPRAEQERAQAIVDRCSPDYPIKVKRVSKHSFIGKSWYQWELVAVEDPKIAYRVTEAATSSFGQHDCLRFARAQLKIQRDGSTGRHAAGYALPDDVKAQYHDASFSGSSRHREPAPDFSTHDPYPYPTHVMLLLDRRTQDLGSDDAELIRRTVAAARGLGVELDLVQYHLSGPTGNEPADLFDLDGAVLDSATLQADLERAKAGQSVPGIEYRRR